VIVGVNIDPCLSRPPQGSQPLQRVCDFQLIAVTLT